MRIYIRKHHLYQAVVCARLLIFPLTYTSRILFCLFVPSSWYCLPWTEYLHPHQKKKLVLNSNPQSDGMWRWDLGEVIRSWGQAFRNGISVLMKEAPESPLLICTTRQHSKKIHRLWTKKMVLTRFWICQHLDLGLPGFRTVTNKFMLFTSPSVYDIFVMAAETHCQISINISKLFGFHYLWPSLILHTRIVWKVSFKFHSNILRIFAHSHKICSSGREGKSFQCSMKCNWMDGSVIHKVAQWYSF